MLEACFLLLYGMGNQVNKKIILGFILTVFCFLKSDYNEYSSSKLVENENMLSLFFGVYKVKCLLSNFSQSNENAGGYKNKSFLVLPLVGVLALPVLHDLGWSAVPVLKNNGYNNLAEKCKQTLERIEKNKLMKPILIGSSSVNFALHSWEVLTESNLFNAAECISEVNRIRYLWNR